MSGECSRVACLNEFLHNIAFTSLSTFCFQLSITLGVKLPECLKSIDKVFGALEDSSSN
jgi:hypothetical protein